MQAKITTNYGFVFWFHLFITVLSWFAPFLFTWYLPIAVYIIVLCQFFVFGRCVLNRVHALSDESTDYTFYGYLLETVGFEVNHRKVKRFVRFYLYFILTAVTLTWQLVLKNAPLMF
jgi:hypothetical protein